MNIWSIMSARKVNAPHGSIFSKVGLAATQPRLPCHDTCVFNSAIGVLIPNIIHQVKCFVEVPHVQMWILLLTLGHKLVIVLVSCDQLPPIFGWFEINLVHAPLLVIKVMNCSPIEVSLQAFFVMVHGWYSLIEQTLFKIHFILFEQEFPRTKVQPVKEVHTAEWNFSLPPEIVILKAITSMTSWIDSFAQSNGPTKKVVVRPGDGDAPRWTIVPVQHFLYCSLFMSQ
mmetsp:Transcript_26650/g.56310  ORF Transcript_26650/g.56310 Transcript_26650/m.56310 type:complete len:228 (-) Transcript_26650:591-1274(-)